MMNIKLSEFRHARNLARAYRASNARQEISPHQWREKGLIYLAIELTEAMEVFHRNGQLEVYYRAVSPEWDWQ